MQNATRKSITDHCCSFIVAMVILWILVEYRDAYPFNYMLLFIWILALFASLAPACLIILSNQGGLDDLAEEIFLISINDLRRDRLIELFKYCRPNCSSIRDKLMDNKTVMSRAAILALSLSVSLIMIEFQFNISATDLSSYLTMFRSAISCWWIYSLLSGLRFGGYAITECQHRSVATQSNEVQNIMCSPRHTRKMTPCSVS